MISNGNYEKNHQLYLDNDDGNDDDDDHAEDDDVVGINICI